MEYAVDGMLLTIKQVRTMGFDMFAVHDKVTGVNQYMFFSERLAVSKLMMIVGGATC